MGGTTTRSHDTENGNSFVAAPVVYRSQKLDWEAALFLTVALTNFIICLIMYTQS